MARSASRPVGEQRDRVEADRWIRWYEQPEGRLTDLGDEVELIRFTKPTPDSPYDCPAAIQRTVSLMPQARRPRSRPLLIGGGRTFSGRPLLRCASGEMEMDEAGRELPLSHLLTVARAALFGRVHRVVKARTAKLAHADSTGRPVPSAGQRQ